MKIDFSAKPGYYGILTLRVDEDAWRDVHSGIFGRKPVLPRHLATKEDLTEWFQKEELRLANLYVLKRITLRSYHSAELHHLLAERLVSDRTAKKVIGEFQRLGYVNDEDWLVAFIKGQLSKKVGAYAILMKIRNKNICIERASQLIEELDDAESRIERIISLISTRYRARKLNDFQERQKVVAALMRRGFQVGDIKNAIQKINCQL